MANTVEEAIAELQSIVRGITPIIDPGRRYLKQDSNEDPTATARSFAVWPQEQLAEGVYLCPSYEGIGGCVIEVRYPMRAALVDTLVRVTQDALQITKAVATPPIQALRPWVDCRFASHQIERLPESGTVRSLITFEIKQEL